MKRITHTDTTEGLGRRRFVAAALAGGLTSVATASARAADTPARGDANCAARQPSAADAVLLYASMLRDIEISELRNLGNALSKEAREFSRAFDNVFGLAARLEKALCKDQAGSAGARKIKELAAAGAAEAARAQAVFVNMLSEQADDTARCILPPGERCVSKEAAQLINEILGEIRRARELQSRVDVAREAWVRGSRELSDRLEVVRGEMMAAVRSILEYEEGGALGGQAARLAAAASLDQPMETLKKFPEYKSKAATGGGMQRAVAGMSPIELLVLLLGGTRQWLLNPVTLNDRASRGARRVDVTVVNASYTKPAPAADLADTIKGLLRQHCGPGTDGQVKTCQDACVGAYGWRDSVPKVFLAGGIEAALRTGLYGWLNCVKPPSSSIAALAGELADLAGRLR